MGASGASEKRVNTSGMSENVIVIAIVKENAYEIERGTAIRSVIGNENARQNGSHNPSANIPTCGDNARPSKTRKRSFFLQPTYSPPGHQQ